MIAIKLKSFPVISETFVVSNIVYTLQNGFQVKIFADKLLPIENSSQKELLAQLNIEALVEKSNIKEKSKTTKLLTLFIIIFYPRVIYYFIKQIFTEKKIAISDLFTLYRYRKFKGFQVCHVHFNSSLKDIVKLTKLGFIKNSNTSFIVTFHGYDAYEEDESSFTLTYGDFYKKYVKAVTVNSSFLKSRLITIGVPEKVIQVVPIGIDFNFFQGKPKTIKTNQKIKFISVGRLTQLKGHTYGIKLIKQLLKNGLDVEYNIIGEGEENENLQNEINNFSLSKHVKLLGSQSQERIKELLNYSDIFLMTSTEEFITKRQEAFGLVSIEAQACGLPVIGFNSGGFIETIINEKTGYAVEDKNTTQMLEKILTLINSPNKYSSFSSSAIEHAKNFDHKNTTSSYLKLYNKFI